MKSIHKKSDTYGLMPRITALFFTHAKTTFTIWLAVIVFGVLSYTVWLQRQGFPDVAVPLGVVRAEYFVNNPAKVDTDLALPVNEAILSANGVKGVRSSARDNFAVFVIEYDDELTSIEGNNRARQAIEQTSLPPGAQLTYQAVNAAKFDNTYDLLLSVTSTSSVTIEDLTSEAQYLATTIESLRPDLIKTAKALTPLVEGENPETGETVQVQTSFDRFMSDGKSMQSVAVGVVAQEGVDALSLSDAVHELVGRSDVYQTVGTKAYVSGDFADGIRAQVSTLQSSLSEGLIIVIIIGFVLISWRAGIVTALAMATTLLITVGALFVLGMSLNTITLFGLILCLGLIVDDAIIMVEALDAARRSKLSKLDTAKNVTKKVGLASLAGTCTTMLGFAPLLFIGGILGEFIRALPITIITSLAVSLVVSLTLVPLLAKYLMLGRSYAGSKNPIYNLEKNLSRSLARMITRTRESGLRRAVTVGFAVALSLGSLGVAGMYFQKLKFDIFPSTKDSNSISISVSYPEGTTIDQATVLADKTDNIITNTIGDNVTKVTYANTGSARGAQIFVDLIGFEEREIKSPELVRILQDELSTISDVQYRVAQVDAGPPRDDYPFKVQLYGNSADIGALAQGIRNTLDGATVTRTNGTTAKVIRTTVSSNSVLTRVDNKSYIEVTAGFDATDTSALVNSTREYLDEVYSSEVLSSYGVSVDDMAYDFGNESDNQESFSGVLVAFPILMLVMFLLLAIQFRSFTQPLLIFTAIPFSLLGVSLGLYRTDNPLSFFVMVALFALIGIAVNNTILLTDYANQARREGMGRLAAVASAIEQRFRPLVTTSLTSVIALVPLALSDPFWESLAVTLIFGLLSSTLLVVLVFPYFYLINEAFVDMMKTLFRRVVKTKRL